MAAKTAKASTEAKAVSNGHKQLSKRRKADFKGFAPDAISDVSKQHVKDNVLSAEQILDWINNQAELGYKISVAFSAEANFISASAYGLWADMENGGLSLTARHRDLSIAITTLKHLVDDIYLGGKWEEVDNYDW